MTTPKYKIGDIVIVDLQSWAIHENQAYGLHGNIHIFPFQVVIKYAYYVNDYWVYGVHTKYENREEVFDERDIIKIK